MYTVSKCSDMVEGRGPMVFDKLFDSLKEAMAYVEDQEDIYGSKQLDRPQEYAALDSDEQEIKGWRYSGYTIEEVHVKRYNPLTSKRRKEFVCRVVALLDEGVTYEYLTPQERETILECIKS